MRPEQIVLVRETTAELVRRAPTGVQEFYERLFELDPSLRPMFPDELVEQRAMFLDTLVAVADALTDFGALSSNVLALGARHQRYGVEAHHYEVVRSALLDALSASLADRFTPDHRAAWTSAYNLIAELMQQAPNTIP